MNEQSKDLVSYRMARAEETLEDARILGTSRMAVGPFRTLMRFLAKPWKRK